MSDSISPEDSLKSHHGGSESSEDHFGIVPAIAAMVEALCHMQAAMRAMEVKMEKTDTTVSIMLDKMQLVENKLDSVDQKVDRKRHIYTASSERIETRKLYRRWKFVPQNCIGKARSDSGIMDHVIGSLKTDTPAVPPPTPTSSQSSGSVCHLAFKKIGNVPSVHEKLSKTTDISAFKKVQSVSAVHDKLSKTTDVSAFKKIEKVTSVHGKISKTKDLAPNAPASGKNSQDSSGTDSSQDSEAPDHTYNIYPPMKSLSADPLSVSMLTGALEKRKPNKRRNCLGWNLLRAVQDGNAKEVRRLLNIGADANFSNRMKWTPLHKAIMRGQTDIVAMLLDRGVNINARNCYGFTALHLAARHDATGLCACFLIYGGCNVNCRNQFGRTPLHYAAECDNVAALRALLVAGANQTIRDLEGKVPYDLATSERVRRILTPGMVKFNREPSRRSINRWTV